MVQKCSSVTCPATNKVYNLKKHLNCRNYGIYGSICQRCSAVYIGQTITPFKDRWSRHRTDWNNKKIDINEKNDQAALLKHFINCHKENTIPKFSEAWKVVFLEEPSPTQLDIRETHWRDILETKNVVNIQKMVWPRVK